MKKVKEAPLKVVTPKTVVMGLTLFDCEPMGAEITPLACQNMQRDEEKHAFFCNDCENPIAPKTRGRRKKTILRSNKNTPL